MRSQQRMPSTDAVGLRKALREERPAARRAVLSRTWRSRSAKMSSTKILQPSCSPKKLTLLPTTGPRSSRTGDSRAVSDVRNLRSALVAKTGRRRSRRRGRTARASLRAVRGDLAGPRRKVEMLPESRQTSDRRRSTSLLAASASSASQRQARCAAAAAARAGGGAGRRGWQPAAAFAPAAPAAAAPCAACRRCRGSARLRQSPRAARRCRRRPSRCRECRPCRSP